MCYLIDAFMHLSNVLNCTLCTVKFMYTMQYSNQFPGGFTVHTQPKQLVSIALDLVAGGGTDQ